MKYKNKMITTSPEEERKEVPTKLFHFHGEGTYKPLNIEAENYEAALRLWEEQKDFLFIPLRQRPQGETKE